MFPQLARFSDLGFLLLRLMVGMVFIASGWNDLKDPETRSKSVGFSRALRFSWAPPKWPGALALCSAS
jgi:putative oxidoreductase